MLIMPALLIEGQTLWEFWIYEHYSGASKMAQKQ